MKLTKTADDDLFFLMLASGMLFAALTVRLTGPHLLNEIREYSELFYFIVEGMFIITVIGYIACISYLVIDLLRELNDAINHCDECNSFALKLYPIRTGKLDSRGNEITKEYCKKCFKKLKIKPLQKQPGGNED